jgi:hypothetical protein
MLGRWDVPDMKSLIVQYRITVLGTTSMAVVAEVVEEQMHLMHKD